MLKCKKGYLRGHDLSPKDRQHVLSAYPYRLTGDSMHHTGRGYPMQFKNDLDWLRNTYFRVTKNFNLDHRVKSCESYPTWPDNPELRTS
jgi:hypothetical protein